MLPTCVLLLCSFGPGDRGGPATSEPDRAADASSPAPGQGGGGEEAQGTDEGELAKRVDRLARENQELSRKIDALTDEVFRIDLGGVVPPVGESLHGLGPAASKVYGKDQGVSIGGYGELVYQSVSGSSNEFDLRRAILYVGYKFSDRWVLNSEIEFEHTEETSIEFLTLDYLASEAINARAGLVLVPMGFLNELHEPTTFLSSNRPQTERRILPTTWRENGVGLFGDVGPVSYRAYVINGFDATGFDASGLRGGRQKGSEALAEDLAFVARVDWTDTPGVLVGGSVYQGDAGQEQAGLGDTQTTIWEVHGETRWRGLWLRGLYSMASVDDVARLNAAAGFTGSDSVGEELEGGYVELAYDLMQLFDGEGPASVRPFVRYETVDTQADVPSGFSANSANDFDLVTFGVAIEPIDNVIVKLDYEDWDDGDDRFNASVGYVF